MEMRGRGVGPQDYVYDAIFFLCGIRAGVLPFFVLILTFPFAHFSIYDTMSALYRPTPNLIFPRAGYPKPPFLVLMRSS